MDIWIVEKLWVLQIFIWNSKEAVWYRTRKKLNLCLTLFICTWMSLKFAIAGDSPHWKQQKEFCIDWEDGYYFGILVLFNLDLWNFYR